MALPIALALLADTASAAPAYAPSASAPNVAATAASSPQPCGAPRPGNPNEIVICGEKPDGYRINPDVLNAKKAKRANASPPHNPHETYADKACTVGPMGCNRGPAIDFISGAVTLAKMADRLSKGQEIGSMFETRPTMSEYELYQQAKQQREAAEQAAKAKAVQAKAQAAAAAAAKAAPAQ